MHHSSIIHPKEKKGITHGAAGVIILVNNKYAATYSKVETSPDTAGYVAHITIGKPKTTITNIIGVYMPGDKPTTRKAAYKYIETQTQQCNGTSHTMLVAGDWNATLHSTDRS